MILGKVELLVMAILLSKNIAQCDDRARPRGATTTRRDDRAAVGWAWTGRNLILDEALLEGCSSSSRKYSARKFGNVLHWDRNWKCLCLRMFWNVMVLVQEND